MSAQPVHVAIRPGQGVVARTGAAVLVVLPGGQQSVQEELLQSFVQACEGQATPGRLLARKLVGLLSQRDPDEVPAFGACAPNERGWAVILHQGVTLHMEYGGTVTTLSGFDASTWVDRIVDDGFDSLTLLGEGEEFGAVDTRFRFDGGMIPGAGVTILPAETMEATTVPAPAMAAPDEEPDADQLQAAEEPQEAAQPQAPAAAEQMQAPGPEAPSPQAPAQAPPQPAEPAPTEAHPPVSMGQRSAAANALKARTAEPAAPAPLPERPVPGAAPVTPTADPAQQHAGAATPAATSPPPPAPPLPQVGTDAASAPDGGFFAQGPVSPMPAEEDEPPTLIQSSTDRDADPVATDEAPPPEDMPAEDVPFESVPLLDIGSEAKRDALAVLTADTPKEEIVDASSPLVYGVLSPSGYFNHPDALFCAVTGVSMLHRTHVLVQRPRPPLGVVVADDGSTFTLDSSYVVGREPERDPQVEAGGARPLKLQDSERSLSRVHADIRLIDWDVHIVDRGSANGTYVLPRGGQQWKRLVADTPEKIVPGTRVAFGKRVMTYESHHQINQAVAS